jgi:hypothetical protein
MVGAMSLPEQRHRLAIVAEPPEQGLPASALSLEGAAGERLHLAAKLGAPVEIIVTLRGHVLPPLESGRGRWRIRTTNGQTTFVAASVLSVTPFKR